MNTLNIGSTLASSLGNMLTEAVANTSNAASKLALKIASVTMRAFGALALIAETALIGAAALALLLTVFPVGLALTQFDKTEGAAREIAKVCGFFLRALEETPQIAQALFNGSDAGAPL